MKTIIIQKMNTKMQVMKNEDEDDEVPINEYIYLTDQ